MTESEQSTREIKQYDAEEPTCKYCGRTVKRIIPEGKPYWMCENHGPLDVSEVLSITAGEIRYD